MSTDYLGTRIESIEFSATCAKSIADSGWTMTEKNENAFAVVVREEDTQEILLKETFPEIEEARDRQRELEETADPEGVPTQVKIEREAQDEDPK